MGTPVLGNDVVFYHIMKTAGTTLARLMEKVYGPQAMCPLPLYPGADPAAFLDGVKRPEPRIFTGHPHEQFELWELIAKRPLKKTRMVFLRHPVDRVVSCYHFIRDSRFVRNRVGAFDASLSEALESSDPRMSANMMTKVLASLGAPRDYAVPVGPDDLKLAIANLGKIDLLGLLEEFDLSYAMVADHFGFVPPPIAKWNVNPASGKAHDLPKEVLAAIVRKNVFDFELYEFGRTLFFSRAADAGDRLGKIASDIRQAPETYYMKP